MKVGGQIPWNVTPICETSPIFYLMGRRPMKDVLEAIWRTYCSFWFTSWVSSYNCEDQSRIHQFEKKVLPGLFLGYALYAGEFGRVTYWSQTLRSWRRWTHRKSTRKDSMRKRWYFPSKEKLICQSKMDESKHPEEIRNWEHPPWYGIDQFKERVIFSWRIRRVSSTTSRLSSDAGEAINDFWSMSGSFIYRHHVEHRFKLYSPREESFPIPMKYIDVYRTTHHEFGC